MTAKKKKTGPNRTTGIPDWMAAYLEHGTIPADCTDDAHAFCDWQLLAGHHCTDGRHWPNPNSVRQPERILEDMDGAGSS